MVTVYEGLSKVSHLCEIPQSDEVGSSESSFFFFFFLLRELRLKDIKALAQGAVGEEETFLYPQGYFG